VADRPPQPNSKKKKSRYTADRGVAGAYEGETMTRRGLMTGGALAAGGIATAAFGLPALGFAVGPLLENQEPEVWQDVGPESDFTTDSYVPRVINIVAEIGESGRALRT